MNASPLKVCLIAPAPPPYGGIANWTVLVRRYAQARNDINLQIVDTATRWRAVDDLVIWKRVLFGGLQLIRDYVRFLRVMKSRPDVVHLTTSGQLAILRDIVILFTARCMRIPSVYHLHFGRVQQISGENSLEWCLLTKAIRLSRAVIAIDPGTLATIKHRLPQIQTFQIPNGICLDELPPCGAPSNLRMVLFLGWILPTKGMAELVHAWAKLKMTGWRCVIAGPGSEIYQKELLQYFKPDQLEFLPEQSHDDAMRLMATCDVFVLPSYSEGFPYVIIEAMALGKPIIATNVGAIPEMLANECGMLIPPRDVNALCDALHKMQFDADLRIVMGEKAQRKARTEYSIEKVLEQLVSTWHDVVKQDCR